MNLSFLSPQAKHGDTAAPRIRSLVRELTGLTLIKLLCLAAIYALFFAGASHRLPTDAVAHIADASSFPETR
jgi:hypothetical protein